MFDVWGIANHLVLGEVKMVEKSKKIDGIPE